MAKAVCGRFAPTPSGRMHLGNVFCALLAWLSAKKQGGTITLRIEDLDKPRCPAGSDMLLEDDLHWLGLEWDTGGSAGGKDRGKGCSKKSSGEKDSVCQEGSAQKGFEEGGTQYRDVPSICR